MRITIPCMVCLKELGRPDNIATLELQDSGLYRMTCVRGHESVTCLQQVKFELLFELGAHAILDGYYREAVSSFTSALERFYEFYVLVQCDLSGRAQSCFDAAWKLVSNQSERQLGAFVFLYLIANQSAPSLLSSREVEFRNGVIHKGKIPSRNEATSYGERVASLINGVLGPLRQKSESAVQQAVLHHIGKLRQEVENPNVAFMCAGTMLSLSRAPDEPAPTLSAWLETLREQRSRVRQVIGGGGEL